MAGIGCLTVPAITVQDAAAWPLDMESIVRLNGYEEIKAMGKYQDWFNGADYHIGSEQQMDTEVQELGPDHQSAQNHGQQRRMICNKKRKKSRHEINSMIIPA